MSKPKSLFERSPVLEFLGVFAKALLAFLTSKGLYFSIREGRHVVGLLRKYHVKLLQQLMVFLFLMTFCAIEPFTTWPEIQKLFPHVNEFSESVLTAWGSYGDLSVEDVLAADTLHPIT